MADCENLVLSSVLDNISYDDILLFNGIGNVIYKTQYAKTNISLATGRSSADHIKLLNDLQIKYHEISLEEVCNDFISNNKIIAIVPKTFLLNDIKPKENFVIFNPYYSMFEVTNVSNELITFKISGHYENSDSTEELILKKHKKDLKSIENIKMTPFNYAFKFISIEKTWQPNNNFIIGHMKQNLKKCLTGEETTECGMTKVSGEKFYDEFCNILKNWSSYNLYQKKFFIMSIQAGSKYFYRNEFADVLLRKTNMKKEIVMPLYDLGNAYRKIKHLLKGENFNIDEVLSLLDFIRKEELLTILKIYEYKINIC